MSENKKSHEWILEGIDCANCAAKVERGVAKVAGVANSSVNYMTETLSFEVTEDKEHLVLSNVKQKVKKLEPDVTLKNKVDGKLIEINPPLTKVSHLKDDRKNYEWILEGIDCANCAAKVERGVATVPGVTKSSVNFMTETLSFEVAGGNRNDVLASVKQTVGTLEPDVVLRKKADGTLVGNGADSHKNSASIESISVEETGHKQTNRASLANIFGNKTKITIIRLILGLALLTTGMFLPIDGQVSLGLFILAYLITGYDVVGRAIRNIFRGQVFDENFLMTIATLSAFYIQEYPEAVAVMLFYQVGEVFQDMAVSKSRRSIADLMDIRPDYANLVTENNVEKVAPETIKIGDIILIRPGEKVPLDGKVVEGTSAMDTSALTGESVPRSVKPEDTVLSGFINKNGVLKIAVEKPFAESTVKKILDLVQNASGRKAPTEQFITKFARYYTPIVVIAAALLAIVPPLVLPGATFNEWIYRASIFLVISCPCALVVSIPVGFFGGIGSASRKGILVKGSNFLEGLNDLKYVVMDKTGTLTKGTFEITAIEPKNEVDSDQLVEWAAHAEAHSTHPIADSIKEYYGKEIKEERIRGYNEIPGHGIQATIDGKEVLAGNAQLMEKFSVAFEEVQEIGTVVYLAVEGTYVGRLLIADTIKEDAVESIAAMKKLGIKNIIMLTGDSKTVGETVAKKLGITEVYSELLPQDKVTRFEEILSRKEKNEKVAFVGDGINDTPVLARSDIGIAMGGLGSDAAIEAADVVIMDDKPSKIGSAMQVAKNTRRIVWQNIFFALGVKGLFLILGALGVATMWEAVFADVGVTVIAVLNSMRILNK
ncbi:heavy metal translocating P-type ATPase [Alkalibacterium putridalgicola]|uniref:Cadmium transporter n=1 Tax=Alkalibacterium putridalgicola TaxID=426703 RepID=A0A1H7XB30_9LACT|nr:heavy metal translocating P-type ATPase [Alkalibacterium putridalgicola]GEK90258.1 cadmium transporter [Alkalibacterium putridalgicola]SEM30397.1 Cd2+/Zn2+-exporting ATPase [Alkalibacterium putridalgicola]